MSNEKILLEQLIKNIENDLESGLKGHVTENERGQIVATAKEIYIQLTKIIYDIRYCSKKDCPCCPEYKIKELLPKVEEHLFNPCALFPVNRKRFNELLGE